MHDHDAIIINHHRQVIEDLIPQAMLGRLVKELASLAAQFSPQELRVIHDEIKRICEPCLKSADLSRFSNYEISPIAFKGVTIATCQVGARIFKKQINRFCGRYTLGVYEALHDAELWHEEMRAFRQERAQQAFTVPQGRLQSKVPPSKLKLSPNLKVTLPAFEHNGAPIAAQCYYLTPYSMVLESSEALPIQSGERCELEFPALPQLSSQPTKVNYQVQEITHDPMRASYLTRFAILKRDAKWAETLKGYMEKEGHNIPAILPQEARRTEMDLARAQLLSGSDWIPVFCTLRGGNLVPLHVLQTEGNSDSIHTLSLNDEFTFSASWLKPLSAELLKHKEADLFWLRRDGDTYVASQRELAKSGEYEAFVNAASVRGDLQLLKCRLVKLSRQDHANVLSEQRHACDILGPHINSILYIRDMASLRRRIHCKGHPNGKYPPPSNRYLQQVEHAYPIQLLVSALHERRQQTRYRFGCSVNLRTGLISRMAGALVDFSVGGMKIRLNEALPSTAIRHVWANIDNFHLRRAKFGGIKFDVCGYDPKTRHLRLSVNPAHAELFASHMQKLFVRNAEVFAARSTQAVYQASFDSMNALACLRHPGVHIRLRDSRFDSKRLVQVVIGDPFSDAALLQYAQGSGVMLHRLLADEESDLPSSSLMNRLLHSSSKQTLVTFRHDLKRNTLMRFDIDQLSAKERAGLLLDIARRQARLVAVWLSLSCIDGLPQQTVNTIMKRLGQIHGEAQHRTKEELLAVKHMLSLTNVSSLILALLKQNNLGPDPLEQETHPSLPETA